MAEPKDLPASNLLTLLARLDGAPPSSVNTMWLSDVARSLLRIHRNLADADHHVLRYFNAAAEEYRTELEAILRNQLLHGAAPASGAQDEFPVNITLIQAIKLAAWPAPMTPLLGVLCELALRSGVDRREVSALAKHIRGGLERYESRLAPVLGAARTLAELQANVERYLQSPALNAPTAFEKTWRAWLRNRIAGWTLEDPSWLREAYRARGLRRDLDAPVLEVQVEPSAEPDDAVEVDNVLTDPLDPGEDARTPHAEVARARANHLLRGTDGDLLVPPDFVLPDPRITQIACACLEQAEGHLAAGEWLKAEPLLALGLAIAAGIRELDLAGVRWGHETDVDADHRLAVDPDQPILWRHATRPLHAFKPTDTIAPHLLAVVDVLPWPLPPRLHRLLCQGIARNPETLFPRLTHRLESYRLMDVLRDLLHGKILGATPFRQALAAYLACTLGSDVAQLALGDAFSVSVAPSYYCAASVEGLWNVVAPKLASWFDSRIDLPPPQPHARFGSRLALTDAAAAAWPRALHRGHHSLARRKARTALDEWIEHRNRLAVTLCVATGHRPTHALGQIDLDQVIPEYGLILLQDKQIDPLRKFRIAATGGHWMTELHAFLERLVDIGTSETGEGALARSILASQAPLFRIPSAEGAQDFTPEDLRATMPEALRAAANHYRHRLSQHLLAAGVDPELRFAQLGWVVSPAHATADLSPLSAQDLGHLLGSTLDHYLEHEGWFSARHRITPWTWEDLPIRPWKDWDAIARAQAADHQRDVGRIRQELQERRRATLDALWPRIQCAVAECLPGLVLRLPEARLSSSHERTGAAEPLLITEDLCALLLDRMRVDDARPQEALEGVVARIAWVRLLKRSHREGLTQGFIPRRPLLSVGGQPSPFLVGSGLAIRQIQAIREQIIERARAGHKDDLGYLAYLAVLLFSPYRTVELAHGAVEAARRAVRAHHPGDLLRIPAHVQGKKTHLVFGGIAATLLARRGLAMPKAHAPSVPAIEAWLERILPAALRPPSLASLVATAQAAARIELAGPERLQLLGIATMTPASVDRCLAVDDGWPVRTAPQPISPDPLRGSTFETEPTPPSHSDFTRAAINRLRELLNPERFNDSRAQMSDSHDGWRQALHEALVQLGVEWPSRSNAWALAQYALHLLDHGGSRKSELAQQTLYDYVHRIAGRLLAVAGGRVLLDQDEAGLESIYLAVVNAAPLTVRAEIAEALRGFHTYIEMHHQATPLAWGAIAALAGFRQAHLDPGLYSEHELAKVYEVLQQDRTDLLARRDAAPDLIRLAELRIVQFVVLAASGIRPRSARGLLMADLHLFGEASDWVHVHRTGGYGEAKTKTSIGYVPLEGSLWVRARPWFREWLETEHSRVSADQIQRIPLFAVAAGARKRFGRTPLEHRQGELLRWVTGNKHARLYWLRKTRVTARHRALALTEGTRARDIHRILCLSGHASIETPICSYIADPAVLVGHSVLRGRNAERQQILAASNFEGGAIDVAWTTAGGVKCGQRIAITLTRLAHPPHEVPAEQITAPPPLIAKGGLLPADLDAYARMRRRLPADEAQIQVSLSPSQSEALEAAARKLLVLRGQVPWPVDGFEKPRARLLPPRWLVSAAPFKSALARRPDADLLALSELWAQTGHAKLTGADPDAVFVPSGGDLARVRAGLLALGVPAALISEATHAHGTSLTILRPPDEKTVLDLTHQAALRWLLALVWLWNAVTSPANTA